MTEILIKNADVVVTMDGARRELVGADVLVRGGVIAAVGKGLAASGFAASGQVIDAKGCVVTPGLVNTHHHLYQTLTRAVPGGQDALLFGWLKTLYPIWARFGPEEIFTSAQVGLAELALTGCSMTSDHLYMYPNGARLDDTIAASGEVGLRFHPTRGAMSIGESDGGLPPDALVEREAAILEDCIRVVDRFHDADDGAMVRVGIAPCSPFSVSRDLMRDAALLARDKGVMLHTHLAENDEDVAYSLAKFGCRPGQYAEDLGWVGDDVWHAHCVKLDAQEIDLFSRTGTGVAHCPCSNCRLGSGIAPVRAMRDAGVKVGLGVDGSASNDAGNLVAEARQAMLLQRVSRGADAMSAREALEIATLGGAQVLGRHDCGSIAVGKRADIAIWDVSGIEAAGTWDPVAFLLAGPMRVRDLIVEGRTVVRDGEMKTLDLGAVIARQNRLARALRDGGAQGAAVKGLAPHGLFGQERPNRWQEQTMTHDYKAQQAETFDTFVEIGKIASLPKRAVVNFLFLADEVDAPFAAAEKALKAAGFVTRQDDDGETLEARTAEMEISAAAIWAEEKRATEIVLKFGFDPDGWELVE